MREQRAPKRLVVGIQARSTSKRLPDKVHKVIGKKSVLNRVISSVEKSSEYLNKNQFKFLGTEVTHCVLIPKGDKIKRVCSSKIFEGPEDDVLTRYKIMVDELNPDYIVRVTADCPLIPSDVISNIVRVGILNNYDYVANFFESDDKLYRLVPDGYECEFFTKEMLYWADENATESRDREHVTTIMRTYPDWGKYGVVVSSKYDDRKLSLDTLDDLERITKVIDAVESTSIKAEEKFGKARTHRY